MIFIKEKQIIDLAINYLESQKFITSTKIHDGFLVEKDKIKNEDLSTILLKTYCFFQYYNNNYRPIYHLENYLFNLIKVVHNY